MALPLKYHWRHLLSRRTSTLLTVLVVSAVVGVFTWMVGFALALRGSLAVADDDHKLIVIKRGATAESNSAIIPEDESRLVALSDVATDAATGERLISPEMLTQVSLPRLRDAGRTSANVAVRGVTPMAFKVHRKVRLVRGALFDLGEPQIIVGAAAAKQFAGLEIGSTVQLGSSGNRPYRVVGIFSADGGPMESEIWGYLESLKNAYGRSMYSSVNLRLRDGVDPQNVIDEVEGPAIQLSAWTEPAYWSQQSGLIKAYLMLAGSLIAVMSLAAIFAIANTMFSSVAGRTREIAMLRTIGFSGRQVLAGFVIESVLLALIGGILGCAGAMAWLNLVGNRKDMFGMSTFTTMAFEINPSPLMWGCSLVMVLAVGALGALWPARRAAALDVITALRQV
ncbi:MAG: ABC transporter permease [Phycisphaerae bacterium]|nr:ABC transporter permease [Phycisphaerae bacterium]NUQ46139.1 ABC transporter permease [Phycisphaerae bacterium]